MGNHRVVPHSHFIRCSFWITVFVVRVGCIIEVRAAENGRSSLRKTGAATSSAEQMMASPILDALNPDYLKSNKKKVPAHRNLTFDLRSQSRTSSRSLSPSTNTTAVPAVVADTDSCSSGKSDGYYPNFSSDCTSYYFCAAGYQITYVCPPGRRFDGDKCTKDYECPTLGVNYCENSTNGYYPLPNSPQKYYYCYQKAKVIELSCGAGDVFDGFWKKCMTEEESRKNEEEWREKSCLKKSNGFYPDLEAECRKYYYCIGGRKTELECKEGLVFNGDICVLESRFKCPAKGVTGNSISSTASTNSN